MKNFLITFIIILLFATGGGVIGIGFSALLDFLLKTDGWGAVFFFTIFVPAGVFFGLILGIKISRKISIEKNSKNIKYFSIFWFLAYLLGKIFLSPALEFLYKPLDFFLLTMTIATFIRDVVFYLKQKNLNKLKF